MSEPQRGASGSGTEPDRPIAGPRTVVDSRQSEGAERARPPALFGLPMTIASQQGALDTLRDMLERPARATSRWVTFLNAHNFNVAMTDSEYRAALDLADAVYPDGVAIELAGRLARIGEWQNLPGTDLVPALLRATAERGYRCFLLGHRQRAVEQAAEYVRRRFRGWHVVGVSSGYFASDRDEQRAVQAIAAAQPDLLLVGMGTPKQECFVARYRAATGARVAICVGGLFEYWSGRLVRAPRIVRALRLEWSWILAQQPHKWRRYTIGIATFLLTVFRLRLETHRAEY